MKTSLKILALFFAASLPVTLAAESLGVRLPAGLDSLTAFCAFIGSVILLSVTRDYARSNRMLATRVTVSSEKAAHPLAA